MVTPPAVLYGSWAAAGLILAALGQPWLGLGFALVGMAFDVWAQGRVKRYQKTEAPVAGWPLLLMAIVAIRFALGVSGPLIAWLMNPRADVMLVVVLIQVWSIGVAFVQFSAAPRLLALAAAPICATVLVVIYPSLIGPHGLAVAAAFVMLATILFIISRATHALWCDLFAADQRNKALLVELQAAHATAVQDRDAARCARQEADEANVAKSRFLANMSHEIRTPLNGVIGMAQIMAGDALEDRQKARLEILNRSAHTLLDLINQILDLSRIEEGRLEIVPQPIDADALVHEVTETLRPLAESKGLTFHVVSTGLRWVSADPVRLRQILFNLLSNAIKFTAEGQVALDVARTDAGAVLRVSDTGRGIPADQIGQLFTRFAQIEAAAVDRRDGAGLGLSIVATLVELMGGRIEVESEAGEGAIFVVTLPLTPAQPVKAGEDAPDAEPERALRVLVAEDHPVNQQVIRGLLGQVGIEVEIVDDGLQAVEATQTRDWDLILMDVQMPNMDGPTATRTIRQREADQGLVRTPIIALTANAMVEQVESYLAAGMDAVVSKPIDLKRLLTTISDVISAKT
ncbi:ATP-binding protein [Brevundimonas sp. SPF441]|uniref:ATP-binding protein n=1 Tax=Brevundimonas sp. SPF441 TaxID=2663795 RepID=UPI00129E3F0E|nr:ATP-binding protein [Brevundimonas sp. SPF441]MRL70099.1 response regulator [Brevundimonas sp. SPF441]